MINDQDVEKSRTLNLINLVKKDKTRANEVFSRIAIGSTIVDLDLLDTLLNLYDELYTDED